IRYCLAARDRDRRVDGTVAGQSLQRGHHHRLGVGVEVAPGGGRVSEKPKPSVPSVLERSGYDVVGQAADPQELLRIVADTGPQVAVVDIRMPPTH
ncbi:hypothetical protein H7H37_07105, partial [Mycolicibacterium insubricum]|nr:hypothetical protein [Mycolicibacterium insubricum]